MRELRWAILLLSAGCSAPRGATALHDLHQPSTAIATPSLGDDFYALPFPNDASNRADGSVDLRRYPRLGGTLSSWVEQIDGSVRGAGLNTAVYFRFDAPLAAARVEATAAYLVDVTPSSPEYGRRRPIALHYSDDRGQFIGPYWLALQPLGGLPLRERTTYAAILTDGLEARDGGRVHRAADLDAALQPGAVASSDARIAAAARAYAPLVAWLDAQPNERAHLVGASVLTTMDATSIIGALRRAVYDQAPAPALVNLQWDGEDSPGIDQIYEATYVGPNFMSGDAPYAAAASGGLVLDDSGAPRVQRMESLRVAFTVPEGPMPSAGWPIMIYAHGNGGSYMQFVTAHLGSALAQVKAADGSTLAKFAVISIDQPLHGPRDPSGSGVNPEALRFALSGNLTAGRTVFKQSAADDFQLLRLVESIAIASAPSTGQAIRFDPARIYFGGLSQGSSTGGMFLAGEPDVKAAVLAGAGGSLMFDFAQRATKPVNLHDVLAGLLQDDIDRFHPLLNLVEAFLDDTDEESYGRLLIREPPPLQAPKSIFMPMGMGDSYVSTAACADFALAIGLSPVNPMLAPIDNLEAAGGAFVDLPVAGNLAGGAATGVLVQYTPPPGSDGHMVVFAVPAAAAQASRFLASHAASGTAALLPP
ncbi:MAG: hypothetical protein ACXVDD_11845 [Polyangia bacterium]